MHTLLLSSCEIVLAYKTFFVNLPVVRPKSIHKYCTQGRYSRELLEDGIQHQQPHKHHHHPSGPPILNNYQPPPHHSRDAASQKPHASTTHRRRNSELVVGVHPGGLYPTMPSLPVPAAAGRRGLKPPPPWAVHGASVSFVDWPPPGRQTWIEPDIAAATAGAGFPGRRRFVDDRHSMTMNWYPGVTCPEEYYVTGCGVGDDGCLYTGCK